MGADNKKEDVMNDLLYKEEQNVDVDVNELLYSQDRTVSVFTESKTQVAMKKFKQIEQQKQEHCAEAKVKVREKDVLRGVEQMIEKHLSFDSLESYKIALSIEHHLWENRDYLATKSVDLEFSQRRKSVKETLELCPWKTYPDESLHQGEVNKDGEWEGRNVQIMPGNLIQFATIKNKQIDGRCFSIFYNGNRQVEHYVKDERHGSAVLTKPDGEESHFEFVHGEIQK